MSYALPLPPRPDLEQYRELAKDLQRACRSGHPIEPRWDEFRKSNADAPCTLASAHLFVARAHGFASWAKFARHVEAMAHADHSISKFEAAVDAIVSGDAVRLRALLKATPGLVRARSMREHRSTLLHYVSANGVEDFRQMTPKNIVEIGKVLLDAGADVNAESDAYGGGSTALGLTATSLHPEVAGVQLPLMALLLERGAIADGVADCLRNGRGQAAEFLASRGAPLDLEGAAGVGRLDIVQSFFESDGSLKPAATEAQLKSGFAWACEFGKTGVVEFLLRHGMDAGARLPHGEATGLHWAAFGGHTDIVRLLLEKGVSVDVKDERHNGTPLEWTLHAWTEASKSPEAGKRCREVVALLARAGAKPKPGQMPADPLIQAALRGEMPR